MKRASLIKSLETSLREGEVLREIEYIQEGWTHAHNWYGYIQPGMSPGEVLEIAADELSQSIEVCSDIRHNGHGQRHEDLDIHQFLEAVSQQMLGRDAHAEWLKIIQQMKAYERWGGHPPKIVIMPDEHDAKALRVMVVDDDGTPRIYNATDRARDLLPPPEEGNNAIKTDMGWKTKRSFKAETKLRRLMPRD
jgi:hypothetical protein